MDVRCKNCFRIFDSQYERCPHCGYLDGEPPQELYHLYPGTELLGRYVIGEVLGFGGFGITYKAWDKKFETILAIKEYYPCGIVNRVPGTSEVILFTGKKKDIFVNGLERFLDEAKNMAKFSQNDNIVNVFEYFEDNNTGYIVMELLEGISLNNYLMKQTQKLPMDEIMNITRSVCSALRDLHEIGIIHRDVSPDNIYMCSNGKIKLIDFGAARFSLNEEKKMTIILKPGFAPPEQYEKINKQGPWTDIYALGATVYLLLTGSKPDESTNRKVEDLVVPPKELDPAIPEHISNTIMKAIALDKKKRFSTIDKFENALLKKSKVKEESYTDENPRVKLLSAIALGVVAALSVIFCIVSIIINKNSVVGSDTLQVWYSYEDEMEMSKKENAYKELLKGFKKVQPNVKVSLNASTKDEYEKVVIEAIERGSMPDVFESTNIANSVLKNVVSASELYNVVNYNNFYMYNIIKNKKELKYKLPMGFDIPIIYANSLISTSKDTIINNIDDLGNKESLVGLIGTDPSNEDLFNTVLFADGETDIGLDKENALNKLAADKIAYYFGTTREYYSVQETMSGKGIYKLIYVNKKPVNITYRECYSVSNKLNDKNHKKAVEAFCEYMYSDKGQDILFIGGRNKSIPLNKTAYKTYCEMNTEMNLLLDKINVVGK